MRSIYALLNNMVWVMSSACVKPCDFFETNRVIGDWSIKNVRKEICYDF